MALSKSLVMRGCQCEKSLWLKKNRPDLIEPAPPGREALFQEGHLVGEWGRKHYPGGILIGEGEFDMGRALYETKKALHSEANILYEATASADGCLVRADILVRNKAGTPGWDLIEVKRSASLKDVHLPDVAIQWHVLTQSGFHLKRAFLMHVNTGYVRDGEIDPTRLFKKQDVTEKIRPQLEEVPAWISRFKNLIQEKDCPQIEIGPHCSDPYDCDFIDHCWGELPEDSIYLKCSLGWKKIALLNIKGVNRIREIPDDFKLTENQRRRVDLFREKGVRINKAAIKKFLKTLTRPLYFLDFETIGPAIPPFDGTHPYQGIPFQFSLRIFDDIPGGKRKKTSKGSEIEHVEFLGDPAEDPQPALAAQLAEKIGPKGSVIAWNAGFEAGVLENLAESFPQHKKALKSIKDRLWDLITPFSKRHYEDYRFNGSASLKAVLPVLVPRLKYDNLEIQEGMDASNRYLDLMTGHMSPQETTRTRRALLAYCGRDTQAMVDILRVLKNL